MSETELWALIGISSTVGAALVIGIAMFILDHWYTHPRPEALRPRIFKDSGIRGWGILVRNRPPRWSWPQRKAAENLTAKLIVRRTSGSEKEFHGMWTARSLSN